MKNRFVDTAAAGDSRMKWESSTHIYTLPRVKQKATEKVEVKVAHSCPTLCNSRNYTVHGILQARRPKWVAFPFSRGSSQPRDQTQVPHSCRQILYQLSHKRSPSTLEWVAYPFSSRSFPINWPNFPKIWQIPTQELNQGLLHCRQILYLLSHRGNPCEANCYWYSQY